MTDLGVAGVVAAGITGIIALLLFGVARAGRKKRREEGVERRD